MKAKAFDHFLFALFVLQRMWNASTKNDLIIEVWEKLDCESVGASEIEAIETVVRDVYGRAAVDSPMLIARTLADEGAELRHAEIMDLYVDRMSNRPHDAALRNILRLDDLRSTLRSIRALENLRKKYSERKDNDGLRKVRETAVRGKEHAAETAQRAKVDAATRVSNSEIANWLAIWLQTPEIFEDWVSLRLKSAEFIEKFGQMDDHE